MCIRDRGRVVVRNLFKDRLLHVKDMMFLVVIADMHVGPKAEESGIRLCDPVQDL